MITPRFRRWTAGLLAGLVLLPASAPLGAQTLTRTETRLRQRVASLTEEQIAFLARMVDIPSGTFNVAGVRRAGALFQAELDALGFTTRWVDLPGTMKRAGHLVAERPARRPERGGRRLLLMGHFDTVFEGASQKFERADSIARGAGTQDMKGGDVILLYALKALAAEGLLDRMAVTVVITGDEEDPGEPLARAREALVEAARRNDVALSFEGGSARTATIARRGAAWWRLTVTGRQAHSSGMFAEGAGYGAIYETARILDGWRSALAGERGLSFSPGVIAGGTAVGLDSTETEATASGKTNIVPRRVEVRGDLRFLDDAQKDSAVARMRRIAAQHLPGTSAAFEFIEGYPAMPRTPAGDALLARYDTVSRALGYPAVGALDASRRGAGDISFVAPHLAGIDGLGAFGGGAHSPEEWVSLPSLEMQTARAAVFMLRLAGIRR